MTKILCVEDEADLREDLVEVLEDEGFEVAAASDGAEGLQLLASFKPDLIVSDCLMPVMTGEEMLRKIRHGDPAFSAIPVIFLSAHAQKEQIEEGMDHGASAYMAKPADYEELLATVSALVEDNPPPAPAAPAQHHPENLAKEEDN